MHGNMKTQTPEQGLSRQNTRLSTPGTPLECSTRLRKRSGLNVSYKDVDETIEPQTIGPTLEERRQEVIERYYEEVKQKALALLAERQAGLHKGENQDDSLRVSTALDADRLPTIEEKGDDDQLSKQGTTQGDSETKASDVGEEAFPELRTDTDQGVHQNGVVLNGEGRVLNGEGNVLKDEEVEEIEHGAADGFLEEAEQEEEDKVPELSQELKQAFHEAVWRGDIDLLDDLLDLPGASIDTQWFGENLLMTAIRAGQVEAASYLIDNGANIHHEVPRFEKRDDVQDEIDAKKAIYLRQIEEQKAKKKKTKKKDKEKEMLEQLEKEAEEPEVKTPELAAPNILTDIHCFMSNCRMMAVEFEQETITEIIDEANGDLWPEELVPRKSREKRLKRELLDKVRTREDWVLSEEEVSEPEEPEPELTLKEKLRRRKALSRQTTTEQAASKKGLSRQNTMEQTERASKTPQRARRTTVTSEKDTTLNVSGEKIGGGLPDGLTVAGEDSTLFLTPSPENTPVPAIHHSVQARSTDPRVPYRGTKAFLVRQSANLRYKGISLEIPKGMPKRDYVRSRGSFMAESDLWSQNNVKSRKSSQKESAKYKEIPLYSQSTTDFYNDLQRYQRLRSNTRKVSPWQDDSPEALVNMLKRSKTQTHLSRAEADINKSRLAKENTFTLGDPQVGRSISNSPLRSLSSFAFTNKQPEAKRTEPSKLANDRKPGRSSSSHVLKRYKSEILKTEKPPQTSPSKLSPRGALTQSLRNLHSSVSHYNNLSNVRENTWVEKKASPVNVAQKYYKAKRYSPAGYLKGSRSGDSTQEYQQLSLSEKRKDKTVASLNTLVVA